MWAKFVYETLSQHDSSLAFIPDYLSDMAACRAWADAVVERAAEMMTHAAHDVFGYLDPTPTPAPAASPQAPTQEQAQQQAPAQQVGPAQQQAPAQEPAAIAAAPAVDAAPAQSTAAPVDQRAIAAYDLLLTQAGLAEYPERLQPLLEVTFGTWVISQIDSAALSATVAQWSSNLHAFVEAAKAAYASKYPAPIPA